MTFLPVVAREMSVSARRPGTYWSRAGSALAALIVSGWVLLLASPLAPTTSLGRQLFIVLSYTGFAFALFAGLFATADCISEEKREGTLGLLFLTDLKSYDVVLGKLSAGSLNAAYALGGLVPMIALGMLMGGVTFLDVGLMALALANTLFFALGLGVFISTLSTNERRAMFAGVVTLFVLTAAPFVVAFTAVTRASAETYMWLSPIYPVLAVHLKAWTPMGFTGVSWQASLLLHHLLGWLFLVCACLVVPRLIADLPSLRFAGARAAFDRMLYGNRPMRHRHRTRLLDRNAFLWLVSRERVKPRYAWLFVAFFTGMYLWVVRNYPNLAWDLPVSASIVLTVHATLKVWICSEVCSRLIQDRRAGALELLLTTPLGVKEIARGQSMALARIFLWPVVFLVGAELLLGWKALHSGILRPSPEDRALWYAAAAGMLLLDVWALKWLGLWLSAWGKSIERVLLSTVARGLAVPTLVFASFYSFAQMFSQILGLEFSFRAMLLWWLGINTAFALWLGLRSRWNFLRYFRHCAAGRFDGRAPKAGEMVAETRRSRSAPRLEWIPPWARAHPVAAALLLVFALALGLAAGRRGFWQWRVQAETQRIRADKLPVSMADLEGYIAKPPLGRDAGRILLEAGLPAEGGSGWALWQNMLMRGDARVFFRGEQEGLNETIAANKRQLAALWSITNSTGFHLPPGMQAMNVERLSVLGCIDYLDAVDAGDTGRVLRDVHALIALARALRSSPHPDAQILACQVLRNLTFVWQQRPAVPPPELARIAVALENLDNDSILKDRLIVQRAFLLGYGAVPFLVAGHRQQPNAAVVWANAAIRAVGSEHKRMHRLIRDFAFALELVSKPYPQRLDAMQAWRVPVLSPRQGQVYRAVDPFRTSLAQAFWVHAEFTARANVLKTAIAFQRYHNKWGFLPEKLEDMIPIYLRAVPNDPFAGEPLRVKKGRQWLIYSVGSNRADDGGAYHLYDEKSDLTFRYEF